MINNNGIKVVDYPPDFEDIYSEPKKGPRYQSAQDFIASPPPMREELVEGLIRRGEIAQINNAPKSYKTMGVIDMCLSIATGTPFLGHFPTKRGRVLLIDNECHEETIKNRISAVAQARGITTEQIGDRFVFDCLRGRLTDINSLAATYFTEIPEGHFDLIVLDALYRFMPRGMSENDNGAMTDVFNTLDLVASRTGASLLNVHHTSRGNQATKSVTDVGAGAGAMSRAADTYLVVREHELAGMHVFEGVTRSFQNPEALSIKFEWPCWQAKQDIEPVLAQVQSTTSKAKLQSDTADIETIEAKSNGQDFNVTDVRKWLGCGIDKANRMIRVLDGKSLIESVGEVQRARSAKPTEHYKFKLQTEKYGEFESYK